MNGSVTWLLVSIALYVLEACTTALVCIWFALGATVAFVCSLFGVGSEVCIAVFALVSAVSLILTKKYAKNLFKTKKVATNADALIGKPAIVTQKIDPVSGSGAVMIKGNEWSAVSRVGETIDKGELVEVAAISGVKLVVVHSENPLISIASKRNGENKEN